MPDWPILLWAIVVICSIVVLVVVPAWRQGVREGRAEGRAKREERRRREDDR